jgi:hypothetical protein
MNEDIYKALILVSLFLGFVCGTLVTRTYWKEVYRIYRDEMHRQYTSVLNNFGLTKNNNGIWEMKNDEGTWVKK